MKTSLFATASLLALLAIGASPASALSITLSSSYDHPGAKVKVNGSGFGANAAIDLYFDTTDEMVVVANANGAFAKHTIPVPAGALPGEHWISAVERDNGQGVQKLFTASTDWTELGFDARNRRNNPWENVISTSNVVTLDTMWSRKTGSNVYSSPAIVNGIAYVGSQDKSLYAFDVATGTPLWTVPTGDLVFSSPAVAAGVVYFGSEDGNLYAVDAGTGASRWTATTGGVILSSPAVANGIVYVGSEDSKFYAFDASSGAVLWTATTAGPIRSSAAVFDGVVYIGSSDSNIYAYDAITGALQWQSNGGGVNPNISAPAISAGRVWNLISNAHAPYFLQALRASDGVFIDAVNLGGLAGNNGDTNPAPAVANGIVYVGIDGKAEAFRPDLSLLWQADITSIPSSLTVANGIVYLGDGATSLLALDAATGDTLWSGIVNSTSFSSPAVSNGAVFIGGFNRLYAFTLNGGDNAVYKRKHAQPPSYASLHPDFHLKPTR